jgi:hypothetical protein
LSRIKILLTSSFLPQRRLNFHLFFNIPQRRNNRQFRSFSVGISEKPTLTILVKYVYLSTYEGEVPDKMLALLISLSFNFDSIPSPQFAGDSFCVDISTIDSSSFLCSLSVEPTYCRMEICGKEDNKINFEKGKWHGWVKILCTADSICLCCSHLESGTFSLSNKFTIEFRTTFSQLRQAVSDSIYIYPNPLTPDYTSTSIEYYLTDNAHVSIMIFDKFGNLIWDTETDESAGTNITDWDGTDNDGNRVLSGVYIVCIKATNQTQTVAQYAGKIAIVR